jgi:N6-L-threonylcarbamoyladenine synthase
MLILGIETSCDETSAAVIEDDKVYSNIISSQWVHRQFGGVVPELASREHVRLITEVTREALSKAGKELEQMDGFAVTAGPGLIGAVMTGLNFVKGLSLAAGKKFIGVNHMEGHIYGNFLTTPDIRFPLLAIVVSGGHTQLVVMKEHLKYEIVATTRDDAVGEAFDKVAKILKLGYPGGPLIDKLALKGDENAIRFPRGRIKGHPLDFSYSGLKTAVLNYVNKLTDEEIKEQLNDICASFQKAAIESLLDRAVVVMEKYNLKTVLLAGGVAANSRLRNRILELGETNGWRVSIPDMQYCMDNGAMIARAGLQRLKMGQSSKLTQNAFASLPLTEEMYS